MFKECQNLVYLTVFCTAFLKKVGRPRLRYEDVLRGDLRNFGIDNTTWTSACNRRDTWRARPQRDIKVDVEANLEMLKKRRHPLSPIDDDDDDDDDPWHSR